MKIKNIESFIVGNPWKNWLFVRVETADGLHGIGEGTLGHLNHSVKGAVEDMKSFVIGMDPYDTELMVSRLSREIYGDGGQIKMCAIAALEMACWDIVGKALSKPVYKLLGGKCHEKLRAYANGWYRCERTPEAFVERAQKVVKMGYTAMKFDPFGTGWRTFTLDEEALSLDIVRAVRAAVGPKVDIMVEAHSRFGVATAVRLAEKLAEFNPAWLEEPVPHHNIAATIEVARRSPVPIASGESLSSKHAVADLARNGVVQIVQIEPIHVGGLLASRKIADMVDANYGVIAPHAAASPVATMACIHIDAATPNFYIQEYFHDFNVPWERELIMNSPVCENGYIPLPQRPGLGIDLNMDEVKKHPYSTTEMNLFESDWHKRSEPQGAKR